MTAERAILFVATTSQPGMEDVYNKWYDEVHIEDVVTKANGFGSAQRFRRVDVDDDHEGYLAIYDVLPGGREQAKQSLKALSQERAEAIAANRKPIMPLSPALATAQATYYIEVSSGDSEVSGSAAPLLLLAQSAHLPETDQQRYGDWADHIQIPAVTETLPGLVRARRFRTADGSAQDAPTNLVLFEVRGDVHWKVIFDDLAAVIQRTGGGLTDEAVKVECFREIGPRRAAADFG